SKLERLMKKYKEKLVSRGRKGEGRKEFAEIGEDIGSVKDDSSKIRDSIVKVKTFDIKPIPPEEAILQMEMLGHDFFVFINSESGKTAVVYRRKDKNYGLIEPSI
ncbi:MAG: sigma 54 modulation/S30EA ribosomal C-terminal domain-containing protein, partial [Actinomycetota bacterium]|nr:sigma 54 modulation/S30EA ribosomal C-terminal domain-containing protein [Actinomycetota bacterium]